MDKLRHAHQCISSILEDEIAPLFEPGAKLTVVMRHPEISDDCWLVVSDDDMQAVSDVVLREPARTIPATAETER